MLDTLELENYTIHREEPNKIRIKEDGKTEDIIAELETLEDFDTNLNLFSLYFSQEEIDDIIQWYFKIYIGDVDYFSFEEVQSKNRLKVIRYLKTRELEKYIQSMPYFASVDVVTDDYCTILSRDKYLCAECLMDIETISNFTLKRIKENEYGVRYTFERGDGL